MWEKQPRAGVARPRRAFSVGVLCCRHWLVYACWHCWRTPSWRSARTRQNFAIDLHAFVSCSRLQAAKRADHCGAWPHSTAFPATDGHLGHAQLAAKLFLGQAQGFPKADDEPRFDRLLRCEYGTQSVQSPHGGGKQQRLSGSTWPEPCCAQRNGEHPALSERHDIRKVHAGLPCQMDIAGHLSPCSRA